MMQIFAVAHGFSNRLFAWWTFVAKTIQTNAAAAVKNHCKLQYHFRCANQRATVCFMKLAASHATWRLITMVNRTSTHAHLSRTGFCRLGLSRNEIRMHDLEKFAVK